MIFTRSVPPKRYKDYRKYRPLLREDFRNRCAYCLTHEFFAGGEGGFEIDHHRPQRGPAARPDLAAEYANLYWCCAECNSNKGYTWPTSAEERAGFRFLDPCMPSDDHEAHWRFNPDGTLTPLTPVGEYTDLHLMLWRASLVGRRKMICDAQIQATRVQAHLADKEIDAGLRGDLETMLSVLQRVLTPPVFHRPRKRTT